MGMFDSAAEERDGYVVDVMLGGLLGMHNYDKRDDWGEFKC